MEPRQRKKNRLQNYDYSRPGYYFITACIRNRVHLLGEIVIDADSGQRGSVGRDDPGAPCVCLSEYGRTVEKYIAAIPSVYRNVSMDKYVIMPNHIHFVLGVGGWENGAPRSSRPTQFIPRVMSALKHFSNQAAGFNMWQTSYYDHIIRDEAEYLRICEYIENNPAKWQEDIYYTASKGEVLL